MDLQNEDHKQKTRKGDIPKDQSLTKNHLSKKNFLLISFVLLFIFSGVLFLTFSSQQKTLPLQSKAPTTVPKEDETTNYSVSTIQQSSIKYKLMNGSLYRIQQDGTEEVFIDKALLKDPQLQVSEIVDFKFSANRSKVLLFANAGVTPFLLYYKDLTTDKIIFVDFGREAVWAPNSRYIAYTRGMADAGPLRLYVFDTSNNQSLDPILHATKVNTHYSNIRWNADSSGIIAEYITRDDNPYGNITDEGITEIKL